MTPAPSTPGVLLVAAVSTADRGQDPDSQLIPLRATAARHGWIVRDELVFRQSRWDDASAAEVRRAVLERLRRGDVDILAVWAFDRLSRRGIEDAFALLRELEDHLKVQFYSLQEPFLGTAGASPEQREIHLALLAWSAKWDSGRRSDRLRAKVVSKREASAKLGQRAVWGRGRIATPDEVRAVLEMRGRASVRQIAAATGIPKSQVGRILQANPVPIHPPAQGDAPGRQAGGVPRE